ncbi:MAG: hypothetical protein OJF47_003981 [Nitrospira sp.]|nr:MAG: hypothetical protein OJF47_003981 [Nitrospira sp.]
MPGLRSPLSPFIDFFDILFAPPYEFMTDLSIAGLTACVHLCESLRLLSKRFD